MKKFSSLTLILMIASLGLACTSSDKAGKTQAESQSKTPTSEVKTEKTVKPAPAQATAKAEVKVKAETEGKSKPVTKRVYFTNIKEGDTVKNPVKLSFGVDGMGIRPAGQDINDKTTGHHHLIIDSAGIETGSVVPMDAQHKHYGKGQTSTEVTLEPGKHTLRLQFADGAHRSYGPDMSTAISITVAP